MLIKKFSLQDGLSEYSSNFGFICSQLISVLSGFHLLLLSGLETNYQQLHTVKFGGASMDEKIPFLAGVPNVLSRYFYHVDSLVVQRIDATEESREERFRKLKPTIFKPPQQHRCVSAQC